MREVEYDVSELLTRKMVTDFSGVNICADSHAYRTGT